MERAMDTDSFTTLVVSREGRIITAAFDNPETLNAVTPPVEHELVRFFHEVAVDGDCDVVILTGRGRVFSAGGDIDHIRDMAERPETFDSHAAKRMICALLDCPKPVIAKVNGHAIGLGATLALMCDAVFAADHAKIGDPHVKMGFAAGDGGAIVWPLLIGHLRAKEYLMTGDPILAPDAARIGLINHSVPAAELDARVDSYARRLAAGATQAIGFTKVLCNLELKQKVVALFDASIAYERITNYSADHREAVAAYIEKRDPMFTGR